LVSAVQKSIRRGLVDEACFFSFQIITAGYGQYLMRRLLMTISCEDVGLGFVGAPKAVLDASRDWVAQVKAAKVKPRDAVGVPGATRVALRTVTLLASAPKTRLAATASGASFALRPAETEVKGDGAGAGASACDVLAARLAAAIKAKDEKSALLYTNALFVMATNLGQPKVLAAAWRVLLTPQRELEASPGDTKASEVKGGRAEWAQVDSAVQCLHEVSQFKDYGSARLCLFQALLLRTRWHQARFETPAVTVREVCWWL
jgi:hypothetical protein